MSEDKTNIKRCQKCGKEIISPIEHTCGEPKKLNESEKDTIDESFEKMKKSAYEHCVERRYDIKQEIKELKNELDKLNEIIEKYEEGYWD